MEEAIDLRKIERSAFRSYFEDGMWDIFFGLMFILSGVRTITDNPAFTLMILVIVLVPILGKRVITVPRLGVAEFGERRKRGHMYLVVLIGVVVLVSAGIVVLGQRTDLLDGRVLGDLVFGAMAIVVTGAMGYYFENPRLIVHGIIFAAITQAYGWYGDDAGSLVALAGGSISVAIGLVALALFMRKYPKLAAGAV